MIDVRKLAMLRHGAPAHGAAEASVRKIALDTNMLHVRSDNVVLGKYINNSGTEQDSAANFYCTEYIPVTASKVYAFGATGGVSYYSVMEYASDKTFKKRTLKTAPGETFDLTTQSTTAYVRIGSNIDGTDVTLAKIRAIRWTMRPKA